MPSLRQEKLATQGLGALEIRRSLFRGPYPPRPKLVDAGKALNLQMSWFLNSLCGRPGPPWNPPDQAPGCTDTAVEGARRGLALAPFLVFWELAEVGGLWVGPSSYCVPK